MPGKKWTLVLLHGALPSSCGGPEMQGAGQEAQILLAREGPVDFFPSDFISFHSLLTDNTFSRRTDSLTHTI